MSILFDGPALCQISWQIYMVIKKSFQINCVSSLCKPSLHFALFKPQTRSTNTDQSQTRNCPHCHITNERLSPNHHSLFSITSSPFHHAPAKLVEFFNGIVAGQQERALTAANRLGKTTNQLVRSVGCLTYRFHLSFLCGYLIVASSIGAVTATECWRQSCAELIFLLSSRYES